MPARTTTDTQTQATSFSIFPPGLLDEPGILRLIPISARGLFNARQRGMPHIKLGRRVLYDAQHVFAWMHRQERGGGQ